MSRGCSAFTKKRYNELMDFVRSRTTSDTAEEIDAKIKALFDFDPNKSTYDKDKKKAYKEKKKAEGISTYITSGAKTAYYRNKELLAASKNDIKTSQSNV